jgi:hypothetical protein
VSEGALAFDAERHEYTLGVRRLPSVTEILRPVSMFEYRHVSASVMERASSLGRAVHSLIELDIAGTLDEDALDDSFRPYLTSWRQFRAQSGFVPVLSEARVHSVRYGFAGTLDLLGAMNGRLTLIDAKRTAQVPRSAGPQTAGYEIALRESRSVMIKESGSVARFALHLMPERWQLVPFRDPNDKRVFLSALTIHNYMEKAA